jgi:signal transduction histidine kinase
MRRLVGASRDLAKAMAQGDPVPRLDERRGTHEVREAAHVFNDMGAPQLTDVHALVQSLTDDLQELGRPVQLQGEPVLARVQPRALRCVVDNLLGNALRYGGSAEVSVCRTPTHVRIEIDDQGPGIPLAQMEAVFQPFFRVEASRSRATGGTGLGLYIARDLVQRQGGTLTLANRPEGGLRASVTLPLG